MPAFFLISGMLFNTGKWQAAPWKTFFARRTQSLLVPYLFFELLAIAYRHFLLGGLSIADGLLRTLTLQCNTGANWFLPAMFLASSLLFLYLKALRGRRFDSPAAAVLPALCLFASWVIPTGIVGNQLIRGLVGFGFLYFGHILRPILEKENLRLLVGSWIVLFLCAASAFFFGGNDLYVCSLHMPPLFLLGGLAGTWLTLYLSKKIHWAPLRWFGQNSLVVMGTHQLLIYTIPAASSPLWILGMLLFTLAVESLLIALLNRFFPVLIGKKQTPKP